MNEFKIVPISDTHNKHDQITIPECDFLLHCGDYSFRGTDNEIIDFYRWLNKQPAKHIVSIQGNHELGWERDPKRAKELALNECSKVHLLEDELVEIEGIKIYGTPVTPWFHDWAWNRARNEVEKAKYYVDLITDHYKKMPKKIDILMTHGPPYGILDELVYADGTPNGRFVGCENLLKMVNKIKPDIHVFGHIHCGYGEKHVNGTSFYNVAVCDEMYMPSNEIKVINYLTD